MHIESKMAQRREYEFTLPGGYVDQEGTVHRDGVMRLATAADEILPAGDPRVQKNPSYLIIITLSRVIEKLGSLVQVTPEVIEALLVSDLVYLQDFYNKINGEGPFKVEAICPKCGYKFEVETDDSWE